MEYKKAPNKRHEVSQIEKEETGIREDSHKPQKEAMTSFFLKNRCQFFSKKNDRAFPKTFVIFS